jgi:hypothetical protein
LKIAGKFTKINSYYFIPHRLHPMSGIGAAFALMQRDRPSPVQQLQKEVQEEEEAM